MDQSYGSSRSHEGPPSGRYHGHPQPAPTPHCDPTGRHPGLPLYPYPGNPSDEYEGLSRQHHQPQYQQHSFETHPHDPPSLLLSSMSYAQGHADNTASSGPPGAPTGGYPTPGTHYTPEAPSPEYHDAHRTYGSFAGRPTHPAGSRGGAYSGEPPVQHPNPTLPLPPLERGGHIPPSPPPWDAAPAQFGPHERRGSRDLADLRYVSSPGPASHSLGAAHFAPPPMLPLVNAPVTQENQRQQLPPMEAGDAPAPMPGYQGGGNRASFATFSARPNADPEVQEAPGKSKRKRAGQPSNSVAPPPSDSPSNAGTSVSQAPQGDVRGRKGNPRACAYCRQHKLKCHEFINNTCARCRAANRECIFQQPKTQTINFYDHSTSLPKAYVAEEPSMSVETDAIRVGVENAQIKANELLERLESVVSVAGIRLHTRRIKACEENLYYHKHGRPGHESQMMAILQRPLPLDLREQDPRRPRNEKDEATGWPERGEIKGRFGFVMNPAEDIAPALSPRPSDYFPTFESKNRPDEPDSESELDPHSQLPTILPIGQPRSDLLTNGEVPTDMGTDDGKDDWEGDGSQLWRSRSNQPSGTLSNDAVGRGLIEEKEGKRFFDIFFKWAGNQFAWKPDDHVSFRAARRKSTVLVDTMVAVAAAQSGLPLLSANAIFSVKDLVRQMTIYGDGSVPTDADIQGLIILMVAAHTHSYAVMAYSMCLNLGYNVVFAKLTDGKIRGTAAEPSLIHKGRTWLVFIVYSTLINVFEQKGPIAGHDGLVIEQSKILRSSRDSLPEFDLHLEAHLSIVGLMTKIRLELDPRRRPWQEERARLRAVAPLLAEVDAWTREWADRTPGLTAMAPREGFRLLEEPTQYLQLLILYYAGGPFLLEANGETILEDRQKLCYFLKGFDVALRIVTTALDHCRKPMRSPFPFHVAYVQFTFGLALAMIMYGVALLPGCVRFYDALAVIRHLLHLHDPNSALTEFHDVFNAVLTHAETFEARYKQLGVPLGEDGVWQAQRWQQAASLAEEDVLDLAELARCSEFWHQAGLDVEVG